MIQENMTLEMKKVLSFRSKMTQQEMAAKSQEIESILQNNNAHKASPVVTTTYAVEQTAQGVVMDVEILIPLDKEISVPAGFLWKPHFLLTNALMVRHIGNPSTMQNSVNELNAYIAEHHLTPITTGYNVTVKEARTPLEMEQMEVDIYVGVSPNRL